MGKSSKNPEKMQKIQKKSKKSGKNLNFLHFLNIFLDFSCDTSMDLDPPVKLNDGSNTSVKNSTARESLANLRKSDSHSPFNRTSTKEIPNAVRPIVDENIKKSSNNVDESQESHRPPGPVASPVEESASSVECAS